MIGSRRAASIRAARALLAAALVAWPALAGDVDPFYRQLLEDGLRSYQQGDHARAREELRIAAFGLLENPEELARALAHLALAHRARGDLEGFESTYRRLIDLEERFGAYSSSALRGEVRSALDQAARAQLGAGPLGSTPPAAGGSAAGEAPPAGTVKADAAPTSRPQLCISWSGDGKCGQPSAGTPSAAAAARPAPTPQAIAAYDRLERMALGRSSDKQLRSGFDQASRMAERYPDWLEMQQVTAVLASRSGAFADAVRYFERGGGPSGERPLELFYHSVALFETDRVDEAATLLRRVLPTLRPNREVRKYTKRILSEEGAG